MRRSARVEPFILGSGLIGDTLEQDVEEGFPCRLITSRWQRRLRKAWFSLRSPKIIDMASTSECACHIKIDMGRAIRGPDYQAVE
jgi:hypothetical protein